MLEKHRVSAEEAEEALWNARSMRRDRTVRGRQRYKAIGRTDAGRPLAVVFMMEARHTARVITAFEERR